MGEREGREGGDQTMKSTCTEGGKREEGDKSSDLLTTIVAGKF